MNEVNNAYYQLEMKQAQIVYALFHRIFELESGWYNGHYHNGENGNWHRESYPIPVIGIKGYCDVEILFSLMLNVLMGAECVFMVREER